MNTKIHLMVADSTCAIGFLVSGGEAGDASCGRLVIDTIGRMKEPGGELWTRGYYVGSVGEQGDEQVIQRYVKNQGRKPEEYQKIHEGKQLELFPYQNKA